MWLYFFIYLCSIEGNEARSKTNKQMINEQLVAALKEHTKELKALYIDKTREFATSEFYRICKMNLRTMAEWYAAFEVSTEECKDYKGEISIVPASREYHKKNLYRMRNAKRDAYDIEKAGIDKHVSKKVQKAELHYISSIEKLAYRLEHKGLNINEDFKITSAHVAQNFECTIQFAKIADKYTKSVRAWTILAWGPINAPHYRYLIK